MLQSIMAIDLNNNTTRTIYAESGDGLFYWGPFNSNSIGDIISLTWVFGDAGFNSDQDIDVALYVYDTEGTYPITLTAANGSAHSVSV